MGTATQERISKANLIIGFKLMPTNNGDYIK